MTRIESRTSEEEFLTRPHFASNRAQQKTPAYHSESSFVSHIVLLQQPWQYWRPLLAHLLHGGANGLYVLHHSPKPEYVLLRWKSRLHQRRRKYFDNKWHDGGNHDHGQGLLRSFDILVNIRIGLQEPKRRAESNI